MPLAHRPLHVCCWINLAVLTFLTRSRMHKIHFDSSEARESIFGTRFASHETTLRLSTMCGYEEFFQRKRKLQQCNNIDRRNWTFSHTFLEWFVWKPSHWVNVVAFPQTWGKWWWVFLRVKKKNQRVYLWKWMAQLEFEIMCSQWANTPKIIVRICFSSYSFSSSLKCNTVYTFDASKGKN